MRDSLGVAIHFDQEPELVKETSKKKKEKTAQVSRVKVRIRGSTTKFYLTPRRQITGRKESVEEAKKRILNQVEQFVSELGSIVGSGYKTLGVSRPTKLPKSSRFPVSIIHRSSARTANTS